MSNYEGRWKTVKVEIEEGIAWVTLNRPEKRNAIDADIAAALGWIVEEVERNAAVRVAVLRSGNEDFFCAGADLEAISQGRADELSTPNGGFAGLIDARRAKPWIVAVTGPVLAGGFELCLACDMIVASNDARFGLPEVKRGLFAAGGGAHRLGRWLPRAVTLELLATGEPIPAERAYSLGLINYMVARSDLVETALALARTIAANAPRSVIETLNMARRANEGFDHELRKESLALASLLFATEDAAEGSRAFLEKRKPQWTGR